MVGAKDRATKQVAARVANRTDKPTLQGFVAEHAGEGAQVFTDDAAAYDGMPFDHEAVNHSAKEFVRGDAHTNGIESFWSLFKRGYYGTYHKVSPKHLDRYADEFAGRNNVRDADTVDQMASVVEGMVGKRLTYKMLIADNGRASGARAA